MSSFSCLQSPRRALYRVFVSPLERHEALLARQLLPTTRAALPSIHQNRFFSGPSQQLRAKKRVAPEPRTDDPEDRGFDPRYTTQADFVKSGRDRLPQDHEIKDPRIMVFDNGNYDGPLQTRHVMSRLNESESLRMIQTYVPANPKENKPVQYAVCKIVNKKDEFERQREARERRRVSKQTATKTKELELSWAISENDLQTKIRQLDQFLGKGMKVDVVMGYKKKTQKRVDEPTAAGVLVKMKKAAEDAGAKEYKPQDGDVGKTMRLYLEGTSK
ncbi:translation initiation factor if-3 [Fusarium albosuccineum]|uniref:Translation initiation factor if-3 n=1 Tax=Fusarium albosuccineum TaxID=1237068 RepID=A0A8H4LMS3_9HYPO|nr:translation initiation factor if-3 [Fusarium albosuccineum]